MSVKQPMFNSMKQFQTYQNSVEKEVLQLIATLEPFLEHKKDCKEINWAFCECGLKTTKHKVIQKLLCLYWSE